jgi:hypothetical protein
MFRSALKNIALDLARSQLEKLAMGKSIQLASHQIGGKGVKVKVSPTKHSTLMSAKHSGKGCRLKLDENELETNGDGLFSALKKVGKVLKDSGIARDAVKAVTKTVLPAVAKKVGGEKAGQKASALVSKYGDKVVDSIGEQTGGFGMRHGGMVNALSFVGTAPGLRQRLPSTKFRPQEQDNFAPMLGASHPALNPVADKVADFSMARYYPMSMAPAEQAGRQKVQKMFEPTLGEGFRVPGMGFRVPGSSGRGMRF